MENTEGQAASTTASTTAEGSEATATPTPPTESPVADTKVETTIEGSDPTIDTKGEVSKKPSNIERFNARRKHDLEIKRRSDATAAKEYRELQELLVKDPDAVIDRIPALKQHIKGDKAKLQVPKTVESEIEQLKVWKANKEREESERTYNKNIDADRTFFKGIIDKNPDDFEAVRELGSIDNVRNTFYKSLNEAGIDINSLNKEEIDDLVNEAARIEEDRLVEHASTTFKKLSGLKKIGGASPPATLASNVVASPKKAMPNNAASLPVASGGRAPSWAQMASWSTAKRVAYFLDEQKRLGAIK
jgi:hypothetical protein